MDNKIKRYLDRILEHLIKGTRVELNVGYNFEGIIIYMPFDENPREFISINDYRIITKYFSAIPSFMFSRYCVKHFGLIEEEINYVWDGYGEIMTKKFNNELRKLKNI